MANNMINIILSISDEDRARLDALIDKLAPLKAERYEEIDPEIPESDAEQESQEKVQAQSDKPAEAEKPTETPAQQFTVADVQQKVVALCAAGKKDEVKAIISAYAERVSLIPEDKADEVMGRLNALEG